MQISLLHCISSRCHRQFPSSFSCSDLLQSLQSPSAVAASKRLDGIKLANREIKGITLSHFLRDSISIFLLLLCTGVEIECDKSMTHPQVHSLSLSLHEKGSFLPLYLFSISICSPLSLQTFSRSIVSSS